MHAPYSYEENDRANDIIKWLIDQKIGAEYVWDEDGVNVVFTKTPTKEELERLSFAGSVHRIKTKYTVIDNSFARFIKSDT